MNPALLIRRLAPRKGRAQIAQLVEQRIENPRVAGSIPALGTIFHETNYFQDSANYL
jgi:hypothetical protein